jgi:hypothetical protein
MQKQRILVDQQDITKARLAPDPAAARPLDAGEARLQVESFALTVNNVTYAATGFALDYWRFFPSGEEGQGIVPVWGTVRVIDSRADGFDVGTRVYGYLPMAETVVIRPEKSAKGVFVDQSAHRAGLALVYNTYVAVKPGVAHEDHLRSLLQPLLATSYLLFDWLADNDWFGAAQIIVGSASSKTGLGLCKFLAEPADRPYRIVGLTAEANRAFVEGLGACDQVLSYDQIDQLAAIPSVYVDMAGNAEVKTRLHGHLGDHLRHSAAVGTSHWDRFAPPRNLAGPKPQFFFAPAQIAKRRTEWGPGVIEARITAAWKRIAADAGDWLEVVEHHGIATAPALWADLAAGRSPAREGHVLVV